MELRQIRYVLAIAKYHSFSRAAEALFVSQPAISQQVRALERELHTSLFQRDTRGVALTRDGERFCAAAEPILEQADCLQAQFSDAAPRRQQRLNLGVFAFYRRVGLSGCISDFFADHPDILGCVRIMENYNAFEQLRAGEVDLAILKVSEHDMNEDGVTFDIFTQHRLAALMNCRDPLSRQESVTPQELCTLKLLTGAEDSHYYGDAQALFRRSNCQLKVGFMNTFDPSLMLEMVEQERGYLLATDDMGDVLSSPNFTAVPVEPEEKIYTVLAYSSRKPLHGLREEFRDYVSNAMGWNAQV